MSDWLDAFPVERVAEVASATRYIEEVRRTHYPVDRRLVERLDGYTSHFRYRASDSVGVEMTFLPPSQFVAAAYPVERVRVFGSLRHPWVQVLGASGRRWLHVYRPFGLVILCLWTEGDPPELVWQPSDGWSELFRIAQRHLAHEELARRSGGKWMTEDAHGPPEIKDRSGMPPPSRHLRSLAHSWNR